MNVDFSAAAGAIEGMLGGAAARAPYALIALLFFGAFYCAGRIVRALVLRFSKAPSKTSRRGRLLAEALYDVPDVLRESSTGPRGRQAPRARRIAPPSHYDLRSGLDAALTQIDAALAEERTRRASRGSDEGSQSRERLVRRAEVALASVYRWRGRVGQMPAHRASTAPQASNKPKAASRITVR